jgi:hypothetical protein
MLLWGAIGLLGATLLALTTIILLDVRDKGWGNWLDTVRAWQSTLGTVAGFLSAAGALILSTAIQDQAERDRADRAAAAIGQALAYEVERMIAPLERTFVIAAGIDLEADDISGHCQVLYEGLPETLVERTPVYDAVLGQTLDFGDANLALFTRIYAYYADFRREIVLDEGQYCDAIPADRIRYVTTMARGGLNYYQLVGAHYPGVSPLQPETLSVLAPVTDFE